MTYSKFKDLPEGTVFCFTLDRSNSLFYIHSKEGDDMYVQEITKEMPPRILTRNIWERNKIDPYRIYTQEEVQQLIDLLSITMGMVETQHEK